MYEMFKIHYWAGTSPSVTLSSTAGADIRIKGYLTLEGITEIVGRVSDGKPVPDRDPLRVFGRQHTGLDMNSPIECVLPRGLGAGQSVFNACAGAGYEKLIRFGRAGDHIPCRPGDAASPVQLNEVLRRPWDGRFARKHYLRMIGERFREILIGSGGLLHRAVNRKKDNACKYR